MSSKKNFRTNLSSARVGLEGFKGGDADASFHVVVVGAVDELVDQTVFQVTDVTDTLQYRYNLGEKRLIKKIYLKNRAIISYI